MVSSSRDLLGDLLSETDWIMRRITAIDTIIRHCRHKNLKSRLYREAGNLEQRCKQIRTILTLFANTKYSDSLQLLLIDEILDRISTISCKLS